MLVFVKKCTKYGTKYKYGYIHWKEGLRKLAAELMMKTKTDIFCYFTLSTAQNIHRHARQMLLNNAGESVFSIMIMLLPAHAHLLHRQMVNLSLSSDREKFEAGFE